MKNHCQETMSYKLPIPFLLFFYFLLVNNCVCQTYHPIPEDSTVRWKMYFRYSDPFNCVEEYTYEYRMHGDTMINGNDYKKLYYENTQLLSHTTGSVGCSPHPMPGFYAAFRQDTALRKAFIVLADSSRDTLLYDFSLHENDTLRSITCWTNSLVCQDSFIVIDNIDTVTINGQSHLIQRQTINCSLDIYEEFGSTHDPFGGLPGAQIVCVHNDSMILFELDPFLCPNLPGKVNVIESKFIKIFPNPTLDYLQINSEINFLSVKLFSIDGREIYFKNNFGSTLNINMDKLNNGIYYLIIYSNDFTFSKLISKI